MARRPGGKAASRRSRQRRAQRPAPPPSVAATPQPLEEAGLEERAEESLEEPRKASAPASRAVGRPSVCRRRVQPDRARARRVPLRRARPPQHRHPHRDHVRAADRGVVRLQRARPRRLAVARRTAAQRRISRPAARLEGSSRRFAAASFARSVAQRRIRARRGTGRSSFAISVAQRRNSLDSRGMIARLGRGIADPRDRHAEDLSRCPSSARPPGPDPARNQRRRPAHPTRPTEARRLRSSSRC